MFKIADNPPVTFPEQCRVNAIAGRWWVAHTKARNEKALAWDLLRRGVSYFLPLYEKVTAIRNRRFRVKLPLFPGYIFFCGAEEDRYFAMTTNRICQTIEVVDQPGLVSELSALERVLTGEVEVDAYPFAAVGRRCRIIAGPFEGVEGVVVHRNRRARVVIEVGILGLGAVIEIDTDFIEAVD
jgi:transcription antitermination factor NusG